MTPREPDRYEEKARELVRRNWIDHTESTVKHVAAALLREREDALDEAADYVEHRVSDGWFTRRHVAEALRALASPSAAPDHAFLPPGNGSDFCAHFIRLDGLRCNRSLRAHEPAAAPAAQMVTCSTDTDEHHGAHRLRVPTRDEKSWCEDPIPVAAPAAETGKRDPYRGTGDRLGPIAEPFLGPVAPPSEPAAPAPPPLGCCIFGEHSVAPHAPNADCIEWEVTLSEPAPAQDLVGSNARMAILGAESLAARLTEWAGALRESLTAPAQRAEARDVEWREALRLYGIVLAHGRIEQDPPQVPSYDLKLKRLLAARASKPPGAGEGT